MQQQDPMGFKRVKRALQSLSSQNTAAQVLSSSRNTISSSVPLCPKMDWKGFWIECLLHSSCRDLVCKSTALSIRVSDLVRHMEFYGFIVHCQARWYLQYPEDAALCKGPRSFFESSKIWETLPILPRLCQSANAEERSAWRFRHLSFTLRCPLRIPRDVNCILDEDLDDVAMKTVAGCKIVWKQICSFLASRRIAVRETIDSF